MRVQEVPLPLARHIDAAALAASEPCEEITILGSFWPYSRRDYPSHLVKSFKECCPVEDYQPHISTMCEIYANLIVERLQGKRFDCVVRVLGSTEKQPESTRPLSALQSLLCKKLGVSEVGDVFFRTDSRPAMRLVGPLSGPDVIARRIRYASQDLFVRPAPLGGRALLIDDIYNTGASMRVYAYALKEFAGVESVTGVNLAVTRFKAGKDGHGWLRLDTSEFESHTQLRLACIDSNSVCHASTECPAIVGETAGKLRFLADKLGTACAACCPTSKPKRRLWGLIP